MKKIGLFAMFITIFVFCGCTSVDDEYSHITVFVSFEGYNLGHGFYIEPTAITLPPGSSAMDATSALLYQHGFEYSTTWGLDRIQNIHPGTAPNPPAYIITDLTTGMGDGSLGSFDYAEAGGWIVTINHFMPQVGADEYELSAYDVIRWQFSVENWGADLGLSEDRGFWTNALYYHADKTQLIRAISAANPEMRQQALAVIIDPLATAEEVAALTVLINTLEFMRENVPYPVIGAVGGEWAVIAMARTGNVDDVWFDGYLESVQDAELQTWTDYQRVVLSLTALGFDASDFYGNDLTAGFRNFVPVEQRPSHSRTINADIFALIALDSLPYSGDRMQFVASILDAFLGMGWGLGDAPDIDTTAMAITALAPYYSQPEVGTLIQDALNWLTTQTPENPEQLAQIIVALTSLGGAYGEVASDYIRLLLQHFCLATGGFIRAGAVNQMTTEQAAYAFVAYWRFRQSYSPLFAMGDAR